MQLRGYILSQFPRHGRVNHSVINDTVIITMSTYVRYKYCQLDTHAHPHTSTSALGISIVSALIIIPALRVCLISNSPTISYKSLKTLYQGHINLYNYYVNVRSLTISPTGRACTSPHIHFCSGNKDDFCAYCQSSSGNSQGVS